MITQESNGFKILNAISNKSGISLKQILEELDMNVSQFYYTSGKLHGLIEIEKAINPENRGKRINTYFLTKAGELQVQATLARR